MESLFGLQGRRILVIGGGQGMGEASARLLARLGAAVAVLDLELERAEKVAARLGDSGAAAYPIAADVTDEAALVAAIAEVERAFGPLDGMVAVVGVAGWAPLVEMTGEMWDRDQARNLRYFFVAAREAAKRLLGRGAPGAMVAVGSIDGLRSARNHAAYGAAKAGLVNLVKSMAAEWSPHGIRVNCVAPGAIVTPRIPLMDPEKERESMALVPMQRRGEVACGRNPRPVGQSVDLCVVKHRQVSGPNCRAEQRHLEAPLAAPACGNGEVDDLHVEVVRGRHRDHHP